MASPDSAPSWRLRCRNSYIELADCKHRTGRERGRKVEIRWGRHPNVHGNGKTETKRRDERDGVLTFGQGRTTATEELAGVGEELAGLGKDDGGDVGFA
jgi:hypothetical protein